MWTVIPSPIDDLRLLTDGDALTAIEFSPFKNSLPEDEHDPQHPVLLEAARQLADYFEGNRQEFELPLAPEGTEFQQRVWAELQRVEFGRTASYGEIASRLGMTTAASRAVGLANGRNPIPVVIPCHRVIGANGSLTGYAGGLARKKLLLQLEQSEQETLFSSRD